jgi:hypothetical protein
MINDYFEDARAEQPAIYLFKELQYDRANFKRESRSPNQMKMHLLLTD